METKKTLYNPTDTDALSLSGNLRGIDLTYFKDLTSDFGIRSFTYTDASGTNCAGYTLDDNAIALIIQCARYEAKRDPADIKYIKTYFDFIQHCLQPEGYFLNYVDDKGNFTKQNESCNLADVNGKAIWALGRLISISSVLPIELAEAADSVMKRVLFKINTMHSKRAMGFTIKGLYYYNLEKRSDEVCAVIKGMANRLEQMYKHASEKNWLWFEGYIETADCVLSEALLYAYLATGEILYKDISKSSFDFLLTHTFDNANSLLNFNARESDRTVLSHMIHSLVSFYKEFKNEGYRVKVQNAFGLFNDKDSASDEKENFSISATTTVNYLHARLAIESCLCKSEIVDFVNEKSTMNHAIFPISYSLLPVKRSA